MNTALALAPSQRQVLVNVGKRYVVFGPSAGLPQQIQFDPNVDTMILPQVGDDEGLAAERIAETLRVAGMHRLSPARSKAQGDIELVDDQGNQIQVELKVRERDPKARDFELGMELLTQAADVGQQLEVWYFNLERLRLVVMRLEHAQLQVDELRPLDVWERTDQGIFTRSRVVEELEDWVLRVTQLYDEVRTWLSDRPHLRADQSRTVTISEELMQEFAVPDREIPVLDLLEGDQATCSFVPRGLWMIGSWGRIDIITRGGTHMLVARRNSGKLEWQLLSPERQSTRSFDKPTLLTLLSQP